MASLPHPNTVTDEEWLEMPVVDDAIEEVVDGVLRYMPPNKWKQTEKVSTVRRELEPQLDPSEFLVVTENFGLIIRNSPLTSRVPDLAVFRKSTIIERDGRVEVFYLEGGELRSSALLTEGILKPHEFPHVQIDISRIWPD